MIHHYVNPAHSDAQVALAEKTYQHSDQLFLFTPFHSVTCGPDGHAHAYAYAWLENRYRGDENIIFYFPNERRELGVHVIVKLIKESFIYLMREDKTSSFFQVYKPSYLPTHLSTKPLIQHFLPFHPGPKSCSVLFAPCHLLWHSIGPQKPTTHHNYMLISSVTKAHGCNMSIFNHLAQQQNRHGESKV